MFMSTLKYDVNLLNKQTLSKITSLHYNNIMYNIEREQYQLMNDNLTAAIMIQGDHMEFILIN